jgi:membrane fusion protein (multidrug efflux system)
MTRRMVTMLVLTALAFGGIFGWKAYIGHAMEESMQAGGIPPVTVSTAEAIETSWTPSIPAVGSLRALQGVDVTPQLEGIITQLHFESGATVKAGDRLAQQYTANDEAQLAGLVAESRLAELNLERARELLPKKLISRFDFDATETALERARSAEQNLRLTIAQKTIRAPFSGRLGIRQVDVGQYIEPGDTIVRLENTEQMLVDLPVPQRYINQLTVNQPLTAVVDAWPNEGFAGRVRALEPQINEATRTVKVQGAIDNPAGRLLPGMFVRIELALSAQNNVITVPKAAVTYSPYGDAVYVVQPDPAGNEGALIAASVSVMTGASRGDQVAIESGLTTGMIVVTSGQQKLQNGAPVIVDNAVPVSNQPAPSADNN